MPEHPLLILGSARKNGDTHVLVNNLFCERPVNTLDLLDYKVHPYNYSGSYPEDDQFMEVMYKVLEHEKLIFATPVYWYAMSGLLKTFFDRLTDIVTIHKHIGRQMKGKRTFLITTGSDEQLPLGFEQPFVLTSNYLGMEFQVEYYVSTTDLPTLPAREYFLQKLYADT